VSAKEAELNGFNFGFHLIVEGGKNVLELRTGKENSGGK